MAQQDVRLSLRGLWTAPAVTEGPEGALIAAEEVICRRAGVMEPRPGFNPGQVFNPATVGTIRRLLGPITRMLGVNPAPPGAVSSLWDNGTVLTTSEGVKPPWVARAIKAVASRKNLYLTTSDFLRKATSVGIAVAEKAGTPYPALVKVASTGAGNAVPAGSYAAYRAVMVRKDPNGLVVRSAPSGRYVYHNPAGAGVATEVTVLEPVYEYATSNSTATMELYRSITTTAPVPDDELYLVATKKLGRGAAQVAGLARLFEDNTPDANLGAALYTNTTEEGAAAAHDRPPVAQALAVFNGSLFLGNLQYPHRLALARPVIGPWVYTKLMRFVSGSANCVILAGGATGLKVGMIIEDPDADFVASSGQYVRITAIVGTTLTLSRVWVSANTDVDMDFRDSIRVSGLGLDRYYPAGDMLELLRAIYGYPDLTSFDAQYQVASTVVTMLAITDLTGADGDQSILLDSIQTDTGAISLWATNGARYTPELPEPTVTPGYLLPQEILPNGLAWSNNQEPEHFQLANEEQIGPDGTSAGEIRALVPLRTALLVFKADSVWAISGSGAESGFRVDLVDSDLRILTPDCASGLGDKAYVWADRGVFEGSAAGFSPISSPAIADLLEPTQLAISINELSADSLGAWMITNSQDEEIILAVPTIADLTVTDRLYLFNRRTGSWVNWFLGKDTRHGISASAGLAFTIGTDRWDQRSLHPITDTPTILNPYTVDRAWAITNLGTTGTSIHIAASAYSPQVGDLVGSIGGGPPSMIITVTDATHFIVDVEPQADVTFALEAFQSVVTPVATTIKNPGLLKSWGEGSVWWGSLQGVHSYALSVTSSLSTTPVLQTRVVSDTRIAAKNGEAYRFIFPRNHSLGSRLYPSVIIRQGGARWELEAISASYQVAGSRVRKK